MYYDNVTEPIDKIDGNNDYMAYNNDLAGQLKMAQYTIEELKKIIVKLETRIEQLENQTAILNSF